MPSFGATRFSNAVRALLAQVPRYGLGVWACVLLLCLLIPLPTVLVDLLLAANLVCALLLVITSVMSRAGTEFLVFPGVVLVLTASRLALNVATTRLILSQADAGEVVAAFASVVVRGDMLVGVAMFAVITVVQYLVITRGAERVAEVSARFALDGLPGQQAAIEADLRAGAIADAEAIQRRTGLLARARFYGAMDGVTRFIRGDAIASLAIVLLNIGGGLAIGIGRHGLDFSSALDRYGHLTIGDGLLTQIPALLISLATGLLVTRVDPGRSPAASVWQWLDPGALTMASVLLVALACVPGMPTAVFLTAALAGIAVSLWLVSVRATPDAQVVPTQLELHLADAGPADLLALPGLLSLVRGNCCAVLGLHVPEIAVVSAPPGRTSEVWLGSQLIEVLPKISAAGGTSSSAAGRLDLEAVVLATQRAIMNSAERLLDLQDVEDALATTRSKHPAAVREALKVVTIPELLRLCRGLLRERVPLPPWPGLLEAIATEPRLREDSERAHRGECLREVLVGYWLRDLLVLRAKLGPLQWVRVHPDAEVELLAVTRHGVSAVRLGLSQRERDRWLASLPSRSAGPMVVVTTPAARPAFAALLGRHIPFIPVLSTAELIAAGVRLPGESGGPAVQWWQCVEPEEESLDAA